MTKMGKNVHAPVILQNYTVATHSCDEQVKTWTGDPASALCARWDRWEHLWSDARALGKFWSTPRV